jgi:hypothetical protein
LIDEWSECIATPTAFIKGAAAKFFFELNSLPITVIFSYLTSFGFNMFLYYYQSIEANELNFKTKMFLEAEDPDDCSVLSPATIEKINFNSKKLCIKLLGVQKRYWVEPSST